MQNKISTPGKRSNNGLIL